MAEIVSPCLDQVNGCARLLFTEQKVVHEIFCGLGEFTGIIEHARAEESRVGDLVGHERCQLRVFRAQGGELFDKFVAWVEFELGVCLGDVLPHRFHVGAHFRSHGVVTLEGDGGTGHKAGACGDFIEFPLVEFGEPVAEFLGIGFGEGFPVELSFGQFDIRLVDRGDCLAVYAGERVHDEFISMVGEEGDFIAASFEGFEVGALLHLGAGGAGEDVDVLLPFFHAADVVGERGCFPGVGEGRFKAEQGADGFLVRP